MSPTSSILLSLAFALFCGLALSRLAKKIGFPAVTAYLIAGVLIGPFLLGSLNIPGIGITTKQVEQFGILSELALGFIAFSIGNEFRLSQLKSIGRQATIIGIFQALFTTLTVDSILIALHLLIPHQFSLPVALLLGAIATATAPAATLMVIKQYKAKGNVTDVLLPVVAIDDAVGLVVFAISFGIAKSLSLGEVDVPAVVVEPILEVILSLALGLAMGIFFTFCEQFFHSRSKRMAVSVTFVMMTVALSSVHFEIWGIHIAFSSLLSCMMLGTVFCNFCDLSEELMERADRWTAPLLILFFVISGAELELSIFSNLIIVLIGIVYILSRSIGKYFGANLSARFTKCPSNVIKYLGITLLPQAGVALGMANKATELGADGAVVRNITLFAVLVYEIVGPYLTKFALTKAGDIQVDGWSSAREEHISKKNRSGHTLHQ